MLSPIFFPFYTADFKHNYEDFVEGCQKNQLILNTSKTKEIVLDFRLQPLSICTEGKAVKIVPSFKYLRLTVDIELDWTLQHH